MRSIEFGGVCLDGICAAEIIDMGTLSAVPDAVEILGRAGALVLGADLAPRTIRVRLYLDAGFKAGGGRLETLHRQVAAALCSEDAAALVLPDGFEYRGVLCTDAGTWSTLFEDGSCEVAFTAFDPIAYGRKVEIHTNEFHVGGTWRTWPRIELVSCTRNVTVTEANGGATFMLEGLEATGADAVVDCGAKTATAGSADVRGHIALGSDFFALEPGDASLKVVGAVLSRVEFRERWA